MHDSLFSLPKRGRNDNLFCIWFEVQQSLPREVDFTAKENSPRDYVGLNIACLKQASERYEFATSEFSGMRLPG